MIIEIPDDKYQALIGYLQKIIKESKKMAINDGDYCAHICKGNAQEAIRLLYLYEQEKSDDTQI